MVLWKTIREKDIKEEILKGNKSKLHILIHEKEIQDAVEYLARILSKNYQNLSPIFLGVLKGAFIFLSDLVRKINFEITIDFIELSSYHDSKQSSGEIKEKSGFKTSVKNRHVLIIEDIIDTGRTAFYLYNKLKSQEPASVKICTLTNKTSRREFQIPLDYVGFEVPNKFIVGYGIDFNEKYRNLPEIYYIEENK